MAARGDLRVTEIAKVIESHTEVIEEGWMESKDSVESFVSDFE